MSEQQGKKLRRHVSETYREKCREAMRRRWQDPEFRRRRRESQQGKKQ
jgi:hypothetical protein